MTEDGAPENASPENPSMNRQINAATAHFRRLPVSGGAMELLLDTNGTIQQVLASYTDDGLDASSLRIKPTIILSGLPVRAVLGIPEAESIIGIYDCQACCLGARWVHVVARPGPANGDITVTIWPKRSENKAQSEVDTGDQRIRLEMLGQLTGGVAHDFNNLLTIIAGNIDIAIEDYGRQPELLSLLEPAMHATMRGAELISRLRAFARRQVLNPAATDVPALAERVWGLLERTLGEQCTLRLVTDQTPVICRADGLQLENALVNLALNARDAMPSGGTVFLGVQRTTLTATAMPVRQGEVQAGSYAQLLITDTGEGMSPEVLARAFDPFFTTKTHAGTGLGLSTVYGFVRQSQGAISLHSALGAGTTVRILLPLVGEEADIGPESHEGAGAPPSMPAKSPRVVTVLIVEPSAEVSQLAARLLRDLGYNCQLVSDADTALALLRARTDIAVLMTDISLPGGGMLGSELAGHVRSAFPAVAVLLTTATVEPVDPALKAAFTVLRKPYRRSALAAALKQVCG